MEGSLRDVAATFARGANARLLVGWLTVAVAVRVVLGAWSWADLGLAVVLLALQPFGEWAVHRFAMHGRALSFGGRARSTPLRDEHLLHHGVPDEVHFMPAPVVAVVAVGLSALAGLLAPTPQLAATAVVVMAAELLAYVWTHVLLHSRHQGGRWLAGRRRDHRYHHETDVRRCYGVVTPVADRVLGTSRTSRPVPSHRGR